MHQDQKRKPVLHYCRGHVAISWNIYWYTSNLNQLFLKPLISFSICEPTANLSKPKPPAKQTMLNNDVGLCQEAITDAGHTAAVVFLFFFFFFSMAVSHSHTLVQPITSKQCSLAKTAELGSIQFFWSNWKVRLDPSGSASLAEHIMLIHFQDVQLKG